MRRAPDNDKDIRAGRIESSEKQATKARQTDRLIERLEVVEEPRKEWELRMEISAAPRAGAVVAVLRGAVVHRGAFTLGRSTCGSTGRTRSPSPGPTARARRPCV